MGFLRDAGCPVRDINKLHFGGRLRDPRRKRYFQFGLKFAPCVSCEVMRADIPASPLTALFHLLNFNDADSPIMGSKLQIEAINEHGPFTGLTDSQQLKNSVIQFAAVLLL